VKFSSFDLISKETKKRLEKIKSGDEKEKLEPQFFFDLELEFGDPIFAVIMIRTLAWTRNDENFLSRDWQFLPIRLN